MLRTILVTSAVAAALVAPGSAQSRRDSTRDAARDGSRTAAMSCNDRSYDGDRATHCEMREDTIGGANPLDVDAGHNGGISVHGWDRGDILVRSKIRTHAGTDADARRLAAAVRVDPSGARVRADGPDTGRDENWSVSFEINVPRAAMLTRHTNNGGIRVTLAKGFSAQLEIGTTHGGITVDFPVTVQGRFRSHLETTLGAGGPKIRAMTTNGGVSIRQR